MTREPSKEAWHTHCTALPVPQPDQLWSAQPALPSSPAGAEQQHFQITLGQSFHTCRWDKLSANGVCTRTVSLDLLCPRPGPSAQHASMQASLIPQEQIRSGLTRSTQSKSPTKKIPLKTSTHFLQRNNGVIVKVGQPDDNVPLLSPCLCLDGTGALEHFCADVIVLQGLFHVSLVRGKTKKWEQKVES